MKKIITILIHVLIFHGASAQLSVSVSTKCNDYCGIGTGTLECMVFGGTPPYAYQWNIGANMPTISGLTAGQYDVSVIDGVGNTAMATGYINFVNYVNYALVEVSMATTGANNGRITTAIFPDMGSTYLPNGSFQFDLLNSGSQVIQSQSITVPNPFTPYFTFSGLAAGNYTARATFGGGCPTNITFTITEIPNVSPTYNPLPACNGSASGAAYINLHPNPAITSNTFFSNPQSPLSTTDYTISKYKVHLKNGPTITHYRQTRDSMLNITGIAPGMYDLLIYVGDSMTPNSPGFGLDSTLIYTGTLQITDDTLCSLVKGRVFADYNSNCSYEATDLAIPNTIIELNPGGMVGVTDATGNFFIPVTPGSYTLKQYAPAAFKQVCPDTNTFVINIGTGNIVNVPVADTITAQPDVYISCAAGAARPGFSQNIFIRYANNTPHNIGVGQGQFQYDTLQTFVSFTGGTYTTTTGLVSFNLPALSAFGKADFVLVLHTPATAVLGDTLSYMANVPVVLNEVDSLNNSSQQIRIITGSYDPNDITVTPVGFGSAGYVTAYQDLNYQIRFQNTGTDTAFNIVVADTLAMELNRLSVQVLQASHPYRLEIKGRVLQFHFDNILLPDSGTNHIASNGFIVYRIMQAANNAPGTTIKNTAHIYFDFNAPITTNTVTNTIFDCASMASMSINQTQFCLNDSAVAQAQLLFDMPVTWLLNQTNINTGNSCIAAPNTDGLYTLSMVAANSVCSVQKDTTINVWPLPIKPNITIAGSALSSSAIYSNMWYFNGSSLNDTMQAITALATGWYMVAVTNSYGCKTFSDSVYISGMGINDFAAAGIQLYPNPTHNWLQVKAANLISSIVIADAMGRKYAMQQNQNHYNFDTSKWPAGLYSATILYQGKVFVNTFLIQH